jgi:hypothetical protein
VTTTFARPPVRAEVDNLTLSSDLRFSDRLGRVPAGVGEALDSDAAPFARFVSKTSFPITGNGADVTASAATDTTTHSGGRNDDSSLDDR